MRFVAAKSLRPGMVVGRNFYNNSLCVMLRNGVALTDAYIRTIRRVNISGLYIDDEQTRDIVIKPLIEEELKLKFAVEVKNAFTSVKSVVKPDSGKIESIVKTVIDQISNKTDHVVNMLDLKSFDDYTFQHSIDVCILAAVIGRSLGLSSHLLNNLALSAVYHDIGKMFINPNIINKRQSLTESEEGEIVLHPDKGMEYVKKLGLQRNDVLSGIIQHHERMDGAGYPNSIPGEKISLFARVIALSDVFSAITAKRPYEEAILPSEAIEYIMANAGLQFDFDLTKKFVANISAYPVGLTVRLSNGMTGIVAENFAGFTLRPLIKVIEAGGAETPFYINLTDDESAKNITIAEVMT